MSTSDLSCREKKYDSFPLQFSSFFQYFGTGAGVLKLGKLATNLNKNFLFQFIINLDYLEKVCLSPVFR